jgi:hypothetical protein
MVEDVVLRDTKAENVVGGTADSSVVVGAENSVVGDVEFVEIIIPEHSVDPSEQYVPETVVFLAVLSGMEVGIVSGVSIMETGVLETWMVVEVLNEVLLLTTLELSRGFAVVATLAPGLEEMLSKLVVRTMVDAEESITVEARV